MTYNFNFTTKSPYDREKKNTITKFGGKTKINANCEFL